MLERNMYLRRRRRLNLFCDEYYVPTRVCSRPLIIKSLIGILHAMYMRCVILDIPDAIGLL
jgi:hypothetical protein